MLVHAARSLQQFSPPSTLKAERIATGKLDELNQASPSPPPPEATLTFFPPPPAPLNIGKTAASSNAVPDPFMPIKVRCHR